ncbi:MAG TPA: TIGR03621 family F420-dependent LLM class oxidoreductase, partial [Microthrixaceae bacterium]|nr:TIGR03621 family F420-dependent LLM class oxidoreductase [Microthrixaceae bacterium]
MTWADSARWLEDAGYSTVFLPDHFDEGFGPIAAMATAAAVTTELKVGSLVFDCDFRHPAVLAREIATIDQLSNGRVELGVGAGWKSSDYKFSGIPMDPPGVRVSRMIESVQVLRGLLGQGEFSFHGKFFNIENLDGTPEPHTPGGPPLLIGAGAPRMLRYAGANADIVGINPSIHSGEIDEAAARDAQVDRIDQKVGWVREGAGERFDDLELNAWLAVAEITDDAKAIADVLAPTFGATPDALLDSPMVMLGTIGELAEQIEFRRERWGYSYHVIPGDSVESF